MSSRKRVALYVCTTSTGNAERVHAELRQYAVAHDWHVIGEYTDRTGAAPEDSRPRFLEVKRLIDARQADGILTRYPAMAAYYPAEREDLAAWLAAKGATVHYTWKPSTVLSPSHPSQESAQ